MTTTTTTTTSHRKILPSPPAETSADVKLVGAEAEEEEEEEEEGRERLETGLLSSTKQTEWSGSCAWSLRAGAGGGPPPPPEKKKKKKKKKKARTPFFSLLTRERNIEITRLAVPLARVLSFARFPLLLSRSRTLPPQGALEETRASSERAKK